MKPLDRPMLKKDQVDELLEEKAEITKALSPQNPFRNKISKPALMHQRVRSIDKQIETFAPEPLPGDEKDKLATLEKELRSAWMEGMPTEEEMRKNPHGMVDRHRKWEKANKSIIMKWKNVRRQLEPDSDDPDLANIERFRPHGVMDRMVANAQISGAMNYRNIPQEQWDTAFEGKGPENTALKQAERVHEEEKKKTRNYSEEQRQAMRERMALARLKKQSKAAQVSESTPQEPVASEA